MELFGHNIDRKKALEGGVVAAVGAAAVTALVLWGNKPIAFSIESKTLCQDDSPTLVRSDEAAASALGEAEINLASRMDIHAGTLEQQEAARILFKQIGRKGADGTIGFKDMSGQLTCDAGQKSGSERVGLTPKAEELVGEFRAAGVSLKFDRN